MSDILHTLGELCVPQPKSKIKAGAGLEIGEYKFFTSSNIQNKFYDEFLYDKPALIFGTGGNASIHYCDEPFSTSTDCLVLYASNKSVNLKAIYRYLESNMHILEDGFHGAGLKHISKSYLLSIEINERIYEDQDKAVDILDKFNRLIEKRKQQLEKLDLLVKSKFIEMFGAIKKEDALMNLCHFIDYRGKTPEKTDSGLPFITAKNIKMHYMSFDTQEYISKDTYNKVMTRGFPKEGDVVFTTEAPLGNVCRIPHIETEFYIGQRIITMQTAILEPVYLEYALSSESFRKKLFEKSSGSTVTGIRSKLLEKLTIPVPDRELQNEFARFVEQTEKSKSTIKRSLEKLETLKKALMQKYFG